MDPNWASVAAAAAGLLAALTSVLVVVGKILKGWFARHEAQMQAADVRSLEHNRESAEKLRELIEKVLREQVHATVRPIFTEMHKEQQENDRRWFDAKFDRINDKFDSTDRRLQALER